MKFLQWFISFGEFQIIVNKLTKNLACRSVDDNVYINLTANTQTVLRDIYTTI